MDAKVAARVEALKHSMGWDDLVAEFEKQEEKFWKRHAAELRAGKPFDQREMDRALGKLDGIRAILSAPEKAASILERKQKQEEPRE